ncbi:SAM-dependent methyltransferase [Xylanimonas oleitrophica]|uniref:SAM-dependent methyltransferase n=1 Tax=Xylanimonas oleitrophica TaxID=2607479 RepID=A0A2W5WQB0_9MICO|nr:methyltransferase domain-containing protein [Xylanimonas oleitrophica]PZR53769.1 SAM-dependent methyltransferase [Xylanimonas oleitrophica]
MVAEEDPWSEVSEAWAASWGGMARPVWDPLLRAAGVGPGVRVLDVGCGSGELLAHLADVGAVAAGADPAAGMVRLARRAAPGADVRRAAFEDLPFPDDAVDVVVAVNALTLTSDPREALAEAVRVVVPGGAVAVAGWAERARNDLDVVERAVARAWDEELPEDGPLRVAGGLEALLADAGLDVVGSGVVPVPWQVHDDAALVAAVLLGEDEATQERLAPVVTGAAEPFRTAAGGYRLVNAFRWAVARTRA